jgi:hypothetical protein
LVGGTRQPNFAYTGFPFRCYSRAILCRTQLLEAFGPLVADFEACLQLTADLAPQEAEAALTTRVTSYLDVLCDALGSAVPAGRRTA